MVVMQLLFIRADAVVMNITLDIREKVMLGCVAAGTSIALAALLVPRYQIIGLCLSLLGGRAILTIGYPRIVERQLGGRSQWNRRGILRKFFVTLVMFSIAWATGWRIGTTTWTVLILCVVGTLPSAVRSEEHTSELQSHSFISYAVFCLKKKKI